MSGCSTLAVVKGGNVNLFSALIFQLFALCTVNIKGFS